MDHSPQNDPWLPWHDWLEQQAMTMDEAKKRIRQIKIEAFMIEYFIRVGKIREE